MANYIFKGWHGTDKNSVGNMEFKEFDPHPWTEDDIDIKVTHCGICGSDLHKLRSGWGEVDYPIVPGHEVLGTIVRLGKNVKDLNMGQRVGFGPQILACLECDQCKDLEQEQFCSKFQEVYSGEIEGGKTHGGYATYCRGRGYFAIPIPDKLSSTDAAPMLCAGNTVYNPLTMLETGPGKTIGIVGIGGLGHFAIQFGKAMGATMVAISHSEGKEGDVKKLGASKFINTSKERDLTDNAKSLDGIVYTSDAKNADLTPYLKLLKLHKTMIMVGVPETNVNFSAAGVIFGNNYIGGSFLGSRKQSSEMLQLAADKGVGGWVKEWPMSKANEAVKAMEKGEARYRFVLVNEE